MHKGKCHPISEVAGHSIPAYLLGEILKGRKASSLNAEQPFLIGLSHTQIYLYDSAQVQYELLLFNQYVFDHSKS